MNLLDRLTGRPQPERSLSIDQYGSMLAQYGFGYTAPVLMQSLAGAATERPADTFEGLAHQAYLSNGIVFACMMMRQLIFSSARFRWQRLRNGSPSDTFGDRSLTLFERPWPGGTTQDLLSRMVQDVDLAGNSYWFRQGDELVRLRPDWVQIVGKPRTPDRRSGQAGWVKLGYLYTEGGIGGSGSEVAFTVDEVAHFAPYPDPLAVFTGMSWLTPVLREIQNDQAMTKHQRKFMDNGATVNLVIKHSPLADPDAVRRWADEVQSKHGGVDNAWKNLNLYPGADATPVGSNLKDADFGNVRAGGEVRIAAAAGVPPVIVGLSKGLESSTYSNYSQARRRFADGTIHPLWANAAGSMERILKPAEGVRLWYDASDVPFLREDEKDAAEIAAVKAQTISSYITAGYEPESVIAAVEANDLRILTHSGLYSVQLQHPGEGPQPQPTMQGEVG